MPLDAPPPMGMPSAPPPPPAPAPGGPPPTNVDALGGMAGMGTEGLDMVGTLSAAGELILKAAQMAQMMGDQQTQMQLAQILDLVSTLAQQQMQGMAAGPMAANGMGAPPVGPPAAAGPTMASPSMPPPMMFPR